MTNGREPMNIDDWNEMLDSYRERFKVGDLKEEEFRTKLGPRGLGLNAKEIEEEIKKVQSDDSMEP